MVIQHNMAAINANNILGGKTTNVKKSSEKLSSGYRINRSADDAAGLAVSEKMRSKIRGIKQSIRNSQDGVSLVQTFEGALGETVSIIHRMKDLAVQSANGTYSDRIDRQAIQLEFNQLCDEVNQLADTDFNGVVMLNGGEMADEFTFLTNDGGVMWLTPSEAEFPEDGFVNTFQKIEGYPEIEMSIELLAGIKKQLVGDKEVMQALEALNGVSVRSFYHQGIPEYSLIGVDDKWADKFSIRTEDHKAVISITTPKSGTIDVAEVFSTELPHYASTSAAGKWAYQSVATGSITSPSPSAPGNDAFDLSKWTKSYVNSSSATKAERIAYVDWIKATSAKAELVMDDVYDQDTDPLKFTWSTDGNEYKNNDTDASGLGLPIYSDTSKGPQIYIKNLHYYYDDEDMKLNGSQEPYFRVSYSYNNITKIKSKYNNRDYVTSTDLNTGRMYDIWLNNGATSVTLTYDKATDTWSDNFGGSGSANYYGIDYKYYSETSTYYKPYVHLNLKNLFEEDGSLPDGFVISTSVECPYYRTTSSYGYVWNNNAVHTNNYGSTSVYNDFRLEELDPAHPAHGGVDYKVAIHGATYTYDGLTQPDGTAGVWRNAEGEAVNLEDEGIYLPTNLHHSITPLHDGMTITVNNPTMVGEDYIQAKINLIDEKHSINSYHRLYDNLTYTENLVLQVGSRSKDSVDFTFAYKRDNMGDLEADLNVTAKGLGLDTLSLLTQENANDAIDKLGFALSKTSMVRSCFGAIQNRLEHKITNLTNESENATASESQIRDTDMALEMMNYTKENILSQTAQAMLSQSVRQPESVLQLLG